MAKEKKKKACIDHDFVFSPWIITANPPYQQGICKNCYEEITITLGHYSDPDEFIKTRQEASK